MRFPSFRKLFLLISLALSVPALALTPVAARHGMVVTSDPLATQAGVEVLQAGGNAVDAAVGVGFALEVTYPFAGNIGGGGFMMVRMADGPPGMVEYRGEGAGAATARPARPGALPTSAPSPSRWRRSGPPPPAGWRWLRGQ